MPEVVGRFLHIVQPVLEAYPGWFVEGQEAQSVTDTAVKRIWSHVAVVARILGKIGAEEESYNVYCQVTSPLICYQSLSLADRALPWLALYYDIDSLGVSQSH